MKCVQHKSDNQRYKCVSGNGLHATNRKSHCSNAQQPQGLQLTEGLKRYDILLKAGSIPIQGKAFWVHALLLALLPDAAWQAAIVARAAASASLRREAEQ